MNFRENGAIGALLDEYEKVINELLESIDGISPKQLTYMIDEETKDEDCRTIQSVLSHVVESGYCYVVEIRKWMGEEATYKKKIFFESVGFYKNALKEMFHFNEKLFEDYPDIVYEYHDPEKKIKVRWGQLYDVEQLMEHAILHISRHRRQIEKFKIYLKDSSIR